MMVAAAIVIICASSIEIAAAMYLWRRPVIFVSGQLKLTSICRCKPKTV